jgi:hypothetical protein
LLNAANKAADILKTDEKMVVDILDRKIEMSVHQAARIARTLEVMPIVIITTVCHHISLNKGNQDNAELWKPLYYRNSSLGF